MKRNAFTRAGSNGRLTLAVPSKGRMAEPALRLCADAGLSFEATDRALLVPCANAPVDLLLVRAGDVPEYVQDGVVDLGITGANLVAEAAADVVTLAELGFARCTLQAAVPDDAPQAELRDLDGLRVATAYPVSTRTCLKRLGIEPELVPVSGSVEAAPRLGLSDAIVDLVSTGSTASANGLRLLGVLLESQAVLVGSEAALTQRAELVGRLELMISGVVAARRRRYLMMNAPATALNEIRSLLPGMGAPSVHRPRHTRADRRPRGRRRRRRLGPALATEGGRRVVDPRAARRAPGRVRGTALDEVLPRVAEIVGDVRSRGDAALLEWTELLDGERPELRVPQAELQRARLEPDALESVRRLAEAVKVFTEPQRPPNVSVEAVEGVRAERRWLPLSSIGIYVPGGRAAYPSSLVMTAVPAQVAGVERIAVVTPRPAEATLATAHALGIDEVYAVGGAQAVAALAYGTETIAPVDKIVGPGNRWVTAAKLLVSSHVGIDLPAGPSEVVLIADATADADRCAADLLAQAEHGPDSEAILLSLDAGLSAAVGRLVAGHDNVSVEDVRSIDEALERSEAYAPEHLELWLADADSLVARVRNAGTVFVRTSAVVGDYAAGASHVLPTGGLARGQGGLGLENFLKPVQIVTASAGGLERAREIALPLARLEGLPLHAAALELS